jgi:hypothetical protein
MAPTPLLQLWLDQFGERDRIDLRQEMLPRLLELLPPDLGVHVQPGSIATREGDADVRVELTGLLQPDLFGPDNALGKKQVGPIHRTLNTATRTARHHVLQVPAAWRGQHRGRRAIRSSVGLYRALGIERVSLVAVDIGRYVWGMCGFDFASDAGRAHVLRTVVDFAQDVLAIDLDIGELRYPWEIGSIEGEITLAEIADALGAGELNLPMGIADKLHEPMRLGKALLLFSPVGGWEGALDVRDGSLGHAQLLRYTGEHDGH